ncbi:NepR family anti-sigma factor [Methylobacterium goesingense]|nr:NepR family anti-sigma factor [Methylobacterium goesingense]
MSLVDIRGDRSMEDNESGGGPSAEGPAPNGTDATSLHGLSDHTQMRIGLHLRAMYDTIVQQPVPDRFRDLIAKLDTSMPESDSQT